MHQNVFTRAHEIAQCFELAIGQRDRRERSHAQLVGEIARITLVGLDARPATQRHTIGRDDDAVDALRQQISAQAEARRPGLVDHTQLFGWRQGEQAFDQLGNVVRQRDGIRDHLQRAADGDRHADRVLVNIETDELRYLDHWTGFLCGSAPRWGLRPPRT